LNFGVLTIRVINWEGRRGRGRKREGRQKI
jgi:hypothetical protein